MKNTVFSQATIYKQFLFILFIMGVSMFSQKSCQQNKERIIKMAVPGPWRSLHPGLQHTLIADIILKNQFEPLIEFDHGGVPIPLAAKSWHISYDLTEFTFEIDDSRRFSDGSHLSALDFKRSWEASLLLDSVSQNSSLQDILYKLDGFSDFKKTKTIAGLEAVSNKILKLHFTTPYRMALEELSGVRYAAYKEVNKKFIGTGDYVIREIGPHEVLLKPRNDKNNSRETLSVKAMRASEIYPAFLKGDIDVIPYDMGPDIPKNVLMSAETSTLVGFEALHYAYGINKEPGALFEDASNRQALLALIWDNFKIRDYTINPDFIQPSPQIYLPIQQGYLNEKEALQIIKKKESLISDLIELSNKKPIKVLATDGTIKFIESLQKSGLRISDQSRAVPPDEFVEVLHKSHDADIISSVFSISNGDPDGVYHKLGKNGAIASVFSVSENVSNFLEEGRKIINVEELDEHYKKVSREFLKEVPMIHIGFARSVALYRNDKIKINTAIKRRNDGQFQIFELK